jgi:hypothetical protein
MKKFAVVATTFVILALLMACERDADIASRNLSDHIPEESSGFTPPY